MRTFILLSKALADAHRVRMLLALRAGELCVCQITELFGLATSTISKHLSVLHQAGLVESRKEGRWIYYRLPGPEAPATVREAIEWVEHSLRRDPNILQDTTKLKGVLALDPVEICKRQCRN